MHDPDSQVDRERLARGLIEQLQRPAAFPHPARHIQLLETHISWILLTGEFAYKIKKPLDLGFLDFSTLERRRHFCREELRLNRRFAPQLYLDVVPIGGPAGSPKIGEAPAIEWAVQMRQFPADAGLGDQLAAARVSADAMRQLGETVAAAHQAAAIAANGECGSLDSIREPAMDNFATLATACRQTSLLPVIEALQGWTERATGRLAPVFAGRRAGGFVRECHGDLHIGNIVRLGEQYVPFDCLEFDPALRWIDVFSDVAFLFMDLRHREAVGLAHAFLNRYLECTGDYAGLEVLAYYTVYRAAVRAKISAIRRSQQSPAIEAAGIASYLELAGRIAKPEQPPLLVVCQGLSGSGKTWLSEQLIPALPAIRLRSDIIRKQLGGLGELERSDAGLDQGIYAADMTQRTYQQLAEFAGLALDQGLHTIVDATCLLREQRRVFETVADESGAELVIVRCQAPRAILADRILRRQTSGADASEADLDVLDNQFAHQEPLTTRELARSVSIDTAQAGKVEAIVDEICRVRRGAATR